MYALKPPAVYAHESVASDPRYKARLDRVVSALARPVPVTVYADGDLPTMVREKGLLAGRVAMGTLTDPPDPILLFNTFRFDDHRAEREAWLAGACDSAGYHLSEALLGYGPFDWWPATLECGEKTKDLICRRCWRVHFQNGCAHKCHYCSLGGLLVTMVNVEDYIVQFDRLMAQHPWQETFLLEDDADVLCLEPELGCLGPLVEHFGTLDGKYLVLHTKSGNVDWMRDLKHNGRTILCWSLSGPRQSEAFEPVAAGMRDRVDAARRAAEWGYPIRYKFKPIIPMVDWRTDAVEAIDWALARSRPDVISLCVFMWMDVDEMKHRLDPATLDPDFLYAAEVAAAEMAGSRAKPFPPDVRAEIYEHYAGEILARDPDLPVSLSTETAGLWRRMGPTLGSTPVNYVCGCGPGSAPGRRRLTRHPFNEAPGPVGEFERF